MNRIATSFYLLIALTLLVSAGLLAAQPDQSDFTCPVPAQSWLAGSGEWPVNGLQLGVQFYTQADILDLIALSVNNDASLALALELAAAKLNVANGSDPIAVRNALLDSDRLLAEYNTRLPYATGLEGEAARLMLDNASVLEFYNSRQLTPNCVEADIPAPVATAEVTVPQPAATAEIIQPPATTPEVIGPPAGNAEIAPPVSTPEVSADNDDDDSGQGRGRGRGRGRGGDDDSDDD